MQYKFKLGARAYIYPLVALAVCFFMYMHARKAGQAYRQEPRPVQKTSLPADTELSGAVDMDLPALYLFGAEQDISFADELRTALSGRCSVLHIKNAGDDVRSYFGVSQLPCAVLFNKDRDKIADYAPLPSKDELLSKVQDSLGK
ncbi:MAG: hypothetical protein J5746_06380 [Victivallales bacterium]|nr:hypothetical protein [Victivallales bacterium]